MELEEGMELQQLVEPENISLLGEWTIRYGRFPLILDPSGSCSCLYKLT